MGCKKIKLYFVQNGVHVRQRGRRCGARITWFAPKWDTTNKRIRQRHEWTMFRLIPDWGKLSGSCKRQRFLKKVKSLNSEEKRVDGKLICVLGCCVNGIVVKWKIIIRNCRNFLFVFVYWWWFVKYRAIVWGRFYCSF